MDTSLSGLRALAIGGVTHDRYADTMRAGGSCLYAVRTWAALGADPRMIAAVGQDFACDRDLVGIQALVSRAGATLTFDNAEPRVVSGGPTPVPTSLLPEAWIDHDAVLLAPVFGEVDLQAWTCALRPACLGLVLQGWVRRAGAPDDRLPRGCRVEACEPPSLDALRDRLALVVLSDEDLRGLGTERAEEALGRIRRAAPVVVVTRGGMGAVVFERGVIWDVGVAPAAVVDTTGAGDAFAASMLLGLAAGVPVAEAARLGSAAASVVVEGQAGDAIVRLPSVLDERRKAIPVCARGC